MTHEIEPTEPIEGTEPVQQTTFQTRTHGPDFLRVGAVLIAGIAIVVTAAVATGASRSADPNVALGAAGASAAPSAAAPSKSPNGWRGGHDSDGSGRAGGPWVLGRGFLGQIFGRITITAIDGANLTLKTDDGWTRTITLAGSTTITKGGKTIALGDLKVGDTIRFRETRNSDDSYAINAIEVVLPRVAGVVTAKQGETITIQIPAGGTQTIHVTTTTTYRIRGNDTATLADVTVGTLIVAEGTLRSDGSMDAAAVTAGRIWPGVRPVRPIKPNASPTTGT
jgi:hypothetical protein